MNLASLVQISIGAVLINNFVLARMLGLCPFLGVSKKISSAFGMGMAVIFVMGMASVFTWCIDAFILVPYGLSYLQTIVFILVIASLCNWWKWYCKNSRRCCTSPWAFTFP